MVQWPLRVVLDAEFWDELVRKNMEKNKNRAKDHDVWLNVIDIDDSITFNNIQYLIANNILYLMYVMDIASNISTACFLTQ